MGDVIQEGMVGAQGIHGSSGNCGEGIAWFAGDYQPGRGNKLDTPAGAQ